MNSSESTIILTRLEVASLLSHDECIEVVERAFRLYGEGRASAPSLLGIHTSEGVFHIKAGLLESGRLYFAAKLNANFSENSRKHSLPIIQGVILLADGETGRMLAVLDSSEITILRTGAATAVAAKNLSRKESRTLGIIGCGNQGRISVEMIRRVRPIETVLVYDIDRSKAEQLTEQLRSDASLQPRIMENPAVEVRECDIFVTCTPSKTPFVKKDWIKPGTFVAAIGADNEHKQELYPEVLEASTIVTDITSQCSTTGELHHALDAGVIRSEQEVTELGTIVAGKKPGRISEEEIIVFDSTGMALQDVAATSAVYEKGVRTNMGRRVDFQS